MKSANILKTNRPLFTVLLSLGTLIGGIVTTHFLPTTLLAYKELDSTNFKMIGVTTSGGGGVLESTNYNVLSEIGRITADPRNYSTNYRVDQDPSVAFVAAQPTVQCFETDTDGTTDCTSGPAELLSGGMVAICGGNGCYDKARFEIEPYTNPSDTLYMVQISEDNFVSDSKCIDGSTFYPKTLTNCDINDFRTETQWETEDFNIKGLDSDTQYHIKISALHGDLTQSDYSIVASATTTSALLFFDIDIGVKNEGELISDSLVLHFDAEEITGLNDSDKVSQWDDLSGNNNHAVQGTDSRRPLYRASSFDGKPAVEFNPSNVTSLTASADTGIDDEYTAFAVVYPYTQTGSGDHNRYGYSIMATTTRYALWLLLRQEEIKHYAYTGSTTTYGHTTGASVPNNEGSILTVSAIQNTAGTGKIYLDSNEMLTHNPQNNPWEGSFSIGDLRNGRNIGFEGLIAEILVYDSVLSTEDQSLVEQYLGSKWLGWPENNVESSPPYSVTFSGANELVPGSAAVTASTLIWLDVDSSTSGGMAVIQSGENGGLYSSTTTETISSTNLDLDTSLAEGFGLQSYYIDYESSTYLGEITATANYSGSDNVVGEVSTDPKKIYDGDGPINDGRMGIYLKARVASTTTPASDYSESISFVLVPRY
jgi:hypothetical protein